MTISGDLYRTERQQEIVRRINECGRASVLELAQHFQVSEVTIRADLQELSQKNLLLRTHGGAVSANRGLYEVSLADRTQQQVTEKNRIGEAGSAMVSNNDAIILDCSSTSLAIARHLKQHRELTVLTNSLAIAHELVEAPGVTVVMPGGTLRRDMVSLTGGYGLETFQGFHIQKGFFGAYGISISEGLTDSSLPEAQLRRRLVKMCREIVGVVDYTKWGRFGLASFASLKEVQTVVTNKNAPQEMLDQAKAMGVHLVLV
jgi:DeoR/GlpR family transcriptional regulator of sugar metabolism